MRVITGTARGRKLQTLEGLDVRPTTDRVKEAMFSAIQFETEGALVLDLFAGSGQMGIEALSRGARYAVFVDASNRSLQVVKDNLQTVGLAAKAHVLSMDYAAFLAATSERFDIAILDPPYSQGILQKALPLLVPKMSARGKILCEHEKGCDLPDAVGNFVRKKQYRYGKTYVSLYALADIEESNE